MLDLDWLMCSAQEGLWYYDNICGSQNCNCCYKSTNVFDIHNYIPDYRYSSFFVSRPITFLVASQASLAADLLWADEAGEA